MNKFESNLIVNNKLMQNKPQVNRGFRDIRFNHLFVIVYFLIWLTVSVVSL
jgi:hypothetical protein